MRWQQARDKDGNVQINGMQSGEYRVSKCVIDYGALCTVYRLWYKNELLKDCNDFDECKQAAEKHNAEHNRRPAASSPGVRVDGPVGPHTQED